MFGRVPKHGAAYAQPVADLAPRLATGIMPPGNREPDEGLKIALTGGPSVSFFAY